MPTWPTITPHRSVLGVVHNVTAATRLLDVIELIAVDDRLQLRFTVPGSSAFTEGTDEFLAEQGIPTLTWQEATTRNFDLAVTASLGGDLDTLHAPIFVLPHGLGYNKYLSREPGAGSREPGTGNREPVFGLSQEWLLDEHGRPIPDVLVLSHEEQRTRLRRDCPAALAVTMVAGDPCLDRMNASTPLRAEYRHALGVQGRQRLVLLSSTWGPGSLFARGRTLLRRLSGLALDDYRVVLALHPNIRAWHTPWQVERWLIEYERAGVTVLPSAEGWRAALVAADVVVGDHGSVTFYGAALGRPVLLASAPLDAVAPDSAIGRFLLLAPELDDHRDLAEQIEETIDTYSPERFAPATTLATSAPGNSADLIRRRLYRLMNLPEPPWPAEVRAVPIPPAAERTVGTHLVRAELVDDKSVRIARYPVTALDPAVGLPPGTHLVTGNDQPVRRHLELAEIVAVSGPAVAAEVLRKLPGCALATAAQDDGTWLVITASGDRVLVSGLAAEGRLGASVLHAWLAAGRPLDALPTRITVEYGSLCSDISLRVESAG